jgi:hypothetical protein
VTTPPYEVRAAAAGCALAKQLQACVYAESRGEAHPPIDQIDDTPVEEIERGYEFAAIILGMKDPDERQRIFLVRFFQALAELVAEQGAELEVYLYNMISDDGYKVVQRVNQGEEAAE